MDNNNTFSYCIDSILNNLSTEIQNKTNASNSKSQNNMNIFNAVNEIWLGANSLEDVMEFKYRKILKNVINMTIYSDAVQIQNMTKIMNVISQSDNLISLNLYYLDSNETYIFDQQIRLPEKLQYISILGKYRKVIDLRLLATLSEYLN